jgi:hypothetical protein
MSRVPNKSINSGAFTAARNGRATNRVPQGVRPVYVKFEEPGVQVRGELVPPTKADSKE